MHTHQSLADLDSGKNLLRRHGRRLQPVALWPSSSSPGSCSHARGMCAVLAPLVNSYKRLVPGYEAPVYICWARVNRSALIRVPKNRPDKPQAARIELRCPDPTCNPYLAFAVMLRAGLEGIEHDTCRCRSRWRRTSTTSTRASAAAATSARCPARWPRPWTRWRSDELVRETLGDHVTERLLEAKRRSGTSSACASRRGRWTAIWKCTKHEESK